MAGEKGFKARLSDSPGINRYYWNLGFDPDERRQKAFKKRMEQIFQDLKPRVESQMKERLETLHQQFRQAETLETWNRIRTTLIEEFRSVVESRQFFGFELRGPQAEPGIYQVTLTVGKKSFSDWLTIREDPLYDEFSGKRK